MEYIDLGLPSGTLWAAEREKGHFIFPEAVKAFGDGLPKLWQLCELWENCTIEGDRFIGPNGNGIRFPKGGYWSSTESDGDFAYSLCFGREGVLMCRTYRLGIYFTHLCKSKK